MQLRLYFIPIFTLLLAVSAYHCAVLDPDPEATINLPAPVDSVLDGMELYRRDCASCHGINGTPITDQVTDIRGYDSANDYIIALDDGPGTMPRFPELDADQRELLFNYIRDELGK